MVKEDPSLWKIDVLEKKTNQFFLRCVHNDICKNWNNNGKEIESNFITFSRNSNDFNFSADWSKYSNGKSTIIRKFLQWYIRKITKSVSEVLEQLNINIIEESPYGLSVEDLETDETIIDSSREKYRVIKIPLELLMDVIKKNGLPLLLKHDPIREIDEVNYFLNRSHCLIKGFSKNNYLKIRVLFTDIVDWIEGFEPIIDNENG